MTYSNAGSPANPPTRKTWDESPGRSTSDCSGGLSTIRTSAAYRAAGGELPSLSGTQPAALTAMSWSVSLPQRLALLPPKRSITWSARGLVRRTCEPDYGWRNPRGNVNDIHMKRSDVLFLPAPVFSRQPTVALVIQPSTHGFSRDRFRAQAQDVSVRVEHVQFPRSPWIVRWRIANVRPPRGPHRTGRPRR
jgi:hypothetical protein